MSKILFLLLFINCYAYCATTLKFAHISHDDAPKGKMVRYFKQLVEERSAEKYIIEIYPEGKLYEDDRVLEALLSGDVQFAAPSLSKLDKISKKMRIFDLPFLFNNMEELTRFQESDSGRQLLREFDAKGLYAFGYFRSGFKQLSANMPLRTPADLREKKIRVQDSEVLQEQYRQLAALPVVIKFNKVLTALQNKEIDGQENTWSNIYFQGLYKEQAYITHSNHGVISYLLLTSKVFWDSLPPEQQQMFTQAMNDAIAYGNDIAIKSNNESVALIIASGSSKIIELTPKERQQWQRAAAQLWQFFANDVGAQLIALRESKSPVIESEN